MVFICLHTMKTEYKKIKVIEDNTGKFRVTEAPFRSYKVSNSICWQLDKEWLKAFYSLGFMGYEVI